MSKENKLLLPIKDKFNDLVPWGLKRGERREARAVIVRPFKEKGNETMIRRVYTSGLTLVEERKSRSTVYKDRDTDGNISYVIEGNVKGIEVSGEGMPHKLIGFAENAIVQNSARLRVEGDIGTWDVKSSGTLEVIGSAKDVDKSSGKATIDGKVYSPDTQIVSGPEIGIFRYLVRGK